MNWQTKSIRIFIFTSLMVLLSSCVGLNIKSPSSDKQSILILPFKVINTSRSSRYGFNYGYEIVNVDDESIKYEAIFKLSNKEGFLIIDSIPPGYYFVNKISIIPVGTGTRTYNNNKTSRYDTFELVSGAITIFQISLNISVEDHSTQIGSKRYRNNISPVYQSQKDQIIEKLKTLENFNKWKVFGMDVTAQENLGKLSNKTPGISNEQTFGDRSIEGRWADDKEVISLSRRNNYVWGAIGENGGDLSGTRNGDTITFAFNYSPGGDTSFEKGTGELRISKDGTKLVGTRSGGGFPEGSSWTLIRLEAPVQEPKSWVLEPEGFQDYQKSTRPEYSAFATNISSGRWGQSWFSATPKQAMDKALNFCEKTGQECEIYALGNKVVFGLLPTEMMAALEEYYFSVSPALAKKSTKLMIGNRISAKEIIAHLSEASVIGRTQNRLKYKATWKSNGEIIGQAISLGNIESKSNDMGTWSVEDGKLCRQWEQWSGGRQECLVVTKEGDKLYAYDVHVDMIEEIWLTDQE